MRTGTIERFYHPELDLLRFLAFILIFFDHGSGVFHSPVVQCFADASRVGLPLFFILSAYLITELLLRERDSTGTISILNFYIRRILRIWPLYFAFLAFIYVAARLGHGYFPTGALLSFLLLSGNWYSYTHQFLVFGVGILWSISVEEQFYVMWPLLIKWGGVNLVKVCIPIILCVSLLTLSLSAANNVAPQKIWFNSFYQYGYFAVGAALAIYLRAYRCVVNKAVRLWLFSGATISYLLTAYVTSFVGSQNRLGAVSFVLAIATLFGVTSLCLFFACLNLRVSKTSKIVELGKLSFGLYVFHLLALQICEVALRKVTRIAGAKPFLHLTLAFGTTYLFARLSYRFLELPFLKMKDKFAVVPTRSA